MPEAIKSRKFWVTIGSIVSVLASQYFGVEIDPAAIVGLAGIVLSYNVGQGWVDKSVAQAEIAAVSDFSKQQAIAYARSLEARLAELQAEAATE